MSDHVSTFDPESFREEQRVLRRSYGPVEPPNDEESMAGSTSLADHLLLEVEELNLAVSSPPPNSRTIQVDSLGEADGLNAGGGDDTAAHDSFHRKNAAGLTLSTATAAAASSVDDAGTSGAGGGGGRGGGGGSGSGGVDEGDITIAAPPPRPPSCSVAAAYSRLAARCARLANDATPEGGRFSLFVICCIIAAGALVGMQTYPSLSDSKVLARADDSILMIFTLEVRSE